MKTEKSTDFTLREPNFPTLHKKFLKELLQSALKNETWRTPASIKKTHKQFDREWFKVVLKKDIKHGTKVVARKGDVLWAEFHKAEPNTTFMVHHSWSPKQIADYRKRVCSAAYHVRIPANKKLAQRPKWSGELHHTNYRVMVNEVSVIK